MEGIDKKFINNSSKAVKALLILQIATCVIVNLLAFFNRKWAAATLFLETTFVILSTFVPYEPNTLRDLVFVLGFFLVYI